MQALQGASSSTSGASSLTIRTHHSGYCDQILTREETLIDTTTTHDKHAVGATRCVHFRTFTRANAQFFTCD